MKKSTILQHHRASNAQKVPDDAENSNVLPIAILVAFALGDITLSIFNRLPANAVLVIGIFLLQAFSIMALAFPKKSSWKPFKVSPRSMLPN